MSKYEMKILTLELFYRRVNCMSIQASGILLLEVQFTLHALFPLLRASACRIGQIVVFFLSKMTKIFASTHVLPAA